MLYKVGLIYFRLPSRLTMRRQKSTCEKQSRHATRRSGKIYWGNRFGMAGSLRMACCDLSPTYRLFTKAARILEFDKLREVVGDYQQLCYAKGELL